MFRENICLGVLWCGMHSRFKVIIEAHCVGAVEGQLQRSASGSVWCD